MKNSSIKLVKCIPFILFISQVAGEVNFSEHISPIIYQNCTECHRAGEIGAFLPLTNYNEVYDNRNWISYSIATDEDYRHGDPIMPPWPPDDEYSSLVGERVLLEDEVNLFLDWVEQGSPQGDPSIEFPIPEFPEGSIQRCLEQGVRQILVRGEFPRMSILR